MSIPITIGLSYAGLGPQIIQNVALTDGAGTRIDEAISANQTDQLLTMAVDYDSMSSICIFATADMTLKTNSSSVPDDTLSIKANKPMIWYTGCGLPNPFSADVTALYVTNTLAGQLTIVFTDDPTT